MEKRKKAKVRMPTHRVFAVGGIRSTGPLALRLVRQLWGYTPRRRWPRKGRARKFFAAANLKLRCAQNFGRRLLHSLLGPYVTYADHQLFLDSMSGSVLLRCNSTLQLAVAVCRTAAHADDKASFRTGFKRLRVVYALSRRMYDTRIAGTCNYMYTHARRSSLVFERTEQTQMLDAMVALHKGRVGIARLELAW